MLSMNTPLNVPGTAAGLVNKTAPNAAMGANMMTLKPRYATNIKKTKAPKAMRKSILKFSAIFT